MLLPAVVVVAMFSCVASTAAAQATQSARAASAVLAPFTITDGGIAASLTGQPGDAMRGRALVANRQVSMCLLCHQTPIAEARFQGDISSNLAGAGTRWTAAQLRLRIVNSRLLNPDSIMPAYYRVEALTRVGAAWRDKPILDAQQIEDVVAWLQTLK